MLFTTPVILGLAALGNSHMIMNTPVPYGKSSLNNSPLDLTGADFPCKQRPGVYDAQGAGTSMAIGSTQPLKFTGSATHGGGSCQISVTYDKEPTKSSVFKVIHSIEGGCPIQGVAGNNGESADAVDPSTYSFKIPSALPTGDATLAWTWFNKIGNREMYMNCAPITITAGSAKRDDEDLEARNVTRLMERDQAAFNALPNMFVANIGNGCGTAESADLIFPAPGDSVEKLGGSTATQTAAPTGSCAAAVAATGSSGSGATTAAGSAATSAPQASSAPAGGVFATAVSSAVASSAPQASSAASPIASSAPASPASSAAAPANSGTTGSGSAIAAGTACTTEGMWNCIGGTSFQQCASGVWSAAQPVAGGTTCTAGQSTSYTVKAIGAKRAKRAIRFSQGHARRFNPENIHA